MEKVVYLLQVDRQPGALLDFVEQKLLPPLYDLSASDIHFALADDSMLAAADKTLQQAGAEFNVYLTFWLPTALWLDSWMTNAAAKAFAKVLEQQAATVRCYAVTESTVLDVKDQLLARSGGVTCLPGWQQVVTLRIPESISRPQWLDTWLYSHSDIACQTQSTFGYIHNIVQRPLRDTVSVAATVDAIVTENFPDAAMTDPEAFYNAEGDPDKLKQHFAEMMQSCERFIDNSAISVVPMRAYTVLVD